MNDIKQLKLYTAITYLGKTLKPVSSEEGFKSNLFELTPDEIVTGESSRLGAEQTELQWNDRLAIFDSESTFVGVSLKGEFSGLAAAEGCSFAALECRDYLFLQQPVASASSLAVAKKDLTDYAVWNSLEIEGPLMVRMIDEDSNSSYQWLMAFKKKEKLF